MSGHRCSWCCHPLSSSVGSVNVVLASRTLFGAICSSIFSTIIDQAPFAIEDLIAEVKAAEASESEDDEDEEDDKRGEPAMRSDGNKGARKQINGTSSPDTLMSG